MTSKVQFAFWLPQIGMAPKMLFERAAMAEDLGYHSFWLHDHLWPPRLPDIEHHESVALMAAIAARTEKIRLGTLVLCNSFRNPALLAKSLTTIDHISNGRLEIGMGAGWAEDEYRAYGYEFPSTGVRLKQLEESLQILKLMFTENRANFHGRYYTVSDAPNNPKPVQKPHPPITVGGSGEKVMLRLVAKYADRWNCVAGYRNFEQKLGVLKEHCKAAGRDFGTLNISEQVMVCLGENEAEVETKWQPAKGRKPFSYTAIKGTPAQVIEQVRERVRMGITFFALLFSDFGPPQTMRLFAHEVMPAFK